MGVKISIFALFVVNLLRPRLFRPPPPRSIIIVAHSRRAALGRPISLQLLVILCQIVVVIVRSRGRRLAPRNSRIGVLSVLGGRRCGYRGGKERHTGVYKLKQEGDQPKGIKHKKGGNTYQMNSEKKEWGVGGRGETESECDNGECGTFCTNTE
ncbi:hypothetical protein BC940DRAFT_311572 [Gongronella butleri]|nr:hypothetical protein BC940DRAFT_311572 [Gongronella butleri]